MELFNHCGRYQQATLTTLTLNPSTNAWLTTLPLSSQPGYRMRDEQFRLAVRHRLGQLPFDDLREHICTKCARRNIESPSLLEDPDHSHSCAMQQGVTVKQRHDALKQVLAELARSCGYHVEVEPRFPTIFETRLDNATGQFVQHIHRTDEHGDLLLVRNNVRQLIDVTVVRPTTLTLLSRGSHNGGSHIVPLVAATQAEKHKHEKYDSECARHGWKLVPFALESLGAVGSEATRLLASMSSHSTDKSPDAFLQHAHRMLSVALQTGNANVSSQGTADLLMHAIRRGGADLPSTNENGRGPGRNQQRRTATATAAAVNTGFRSIIHADYRSARNGGRSTRANDRVAAAASSNSNSRPRRLSPVAAASAPRHRNGLGATAATAIRIDDDDESKSNSPRALAAVPAIAGSGSGITTGHTLSVHIDDDYLTASTSQPGVVDHRRWITVPDLTAVAAAAAAAAVTIEVETSASGPSLVD